MSYHVGQRIKVNSPEFGLKDATGVVTELQVASYESDFFIGQYVIHTFVTVELDNGRTTITLRTSDEEDLFLKYLEEEG